jgi:two-component system, LuxR family, sensor kinase FixL
VREQRGRAGVIAGSTRMTRRRLWPSGAVPGLLAVALALFLVAAIALTFNLNRLRDSFAWVEHTNEVLRNISAVERALLQAESGERGYLLTGGNSYRDSYAGASAEIPQLLETLKRLISDNPVQSQRLEDLTASLDARLGEFKLAVDYGPEHLNDALAILSTARFKQLTPRIEGLLGQFRQAELEILEARQQSTNRNAVLATFFAAGMTVLALLSSAFGAYFLERQRAISQLRATNQELTKSQENLKRREAHVHSILATVPDAMVIIDERGIIQSFSTTAEHLFGFTQQEAQGKNVNTLMPVPYRLEHDSYIARYLTTGERRIIGLGRTVVGQRKDGGTFPMELSVGEVLLENGRHFIGFVRDLTFAQERERLLHETQSELHVSRLSAMGEMAAALAHELNQPLSAITNYLRGSKLLLRDSTDEHAKTISDALDKAAQQALRAGSVIERLRQFISRGETEKRVESIRKLVEETSALALLTAKDQSIRTSFQFDPPADQVIVDRVQIQQVLLNLLRNAIEAMRTSTCRELVISTASAADNMVVVSVADTGCGIAPDLISKLFQPFVTTKQTGLGIGLSLSRAIIDSHGGQITAEPNPAGGTIFRFTLRGVGTGGSPIPATLDRSYLQRNPNPISFRTGRYVDSSWEIEQTARVMKPCI